MLDINQISSGTAQALMLLYRHGPVFAQDIPIHDYHYFLQAKEMKLVEMHLPDPNFLYTLPEDRRQAYQFFLTDTGVTACELLMDRAHQAAVQKAEQEKEKQSSQQAADERWRKDAVRSWTQFWLGVLFSVIGFVSGVIVEHFFTVWDMFVHLF